MNVNKVKCAIALIAIIGIVEVILFYDYSHEFGGYVDISNTTCTKSKHIRRKLFLHVCLKENKTVYDLRYFWRAEEEGDALKASAIGVQMTTDDFLKICNYCPE